MSKKNIEALLGWGIILLAFSLGVLIGGNYV
jgi:hypothetical protein